MDKLLLTTTQSLKQCGLDPKQRFAVHQILRKQYYQNERDGFNGSSNSFVPMSYEWMEKTYSSLPSTVREMVESGYLESTTYNADGSDGKETFPKSYRIHPDHLDEITVNELANYEVHGRTFNALSDAVRKRRYSVPENTHYLESLYSVLESIKLSERVWDSTESETVQPVVDIFNSSWFFKRPHDARLYTNVTSLKSDLRKFIVHGEVDQWSIVDMNCSNWFLLSCCSLAPDGSTAAPRPTSSGPSAEVQHSINVRGKNPDRDSPSKYSSAEVQHSINVGGKTNTFRRHVQNGIVYERVMAEVGWKSRKYTKTKMNTFLHQDPKQTKGHEAIIKDALNRIYDGLGTWIEKRKKEDGDADALGKQLRKMESRVVVDTTAKRLVGEFGIPVLTIHDGLMVPTDHEREVQIMMEEDFQDAYGTRPKTHIERLVASASS